MDAVALRKENALTARSNSMTFIFSITASCCSPAIMLCKSGSDPRTLGRIGKAYLGDFAVESTKHIQLLECDGPEPNAAERLSYRRYDASTY